ncbi:endonuclease domain-containing protein [Streptomyces sp. NPDC060000]|uniref:endonuclease domain-containing protein n=1 Tax=Streptomyces sp. NPDC060000 TaxID=3347031 RepID=UPI0036C8633D
MGCINGDGRPVSSRGMCKTCYEKERTSQIYRPCIEQGCSGNQVSRGLCGKHYQRTLSHERSCRVSGCSGKMRTRDLCHRHYRELKKGVEFTQPPTKYTECSYEDCSKPHEAKGYCSKHYKWHRSGVNIPSRELLDQERNELKINGRRRCKGCQKEKPLAEFTHYPDGYPFAHCRPCASLNQRLRNYGISSEFYRRILLFQGNRCGICGTETPGRGRTWDIDHDHFCCSGNSKACGKCTRGLLCGRCNSFGLAWYEQLPESMRDFDLLNEYLANPPAQRMRAESTQRTTSRVTGTCAEEAEDRPAN